MKEVLKVELRLLRLVGKEIVKKIYKFTFYYYA